MPLCLACGAPAIAQWTRRPTPDELARAVTVAAERESALRLALVPADTPDADVPGVNFGPPPSEADTTVPVYACGPHTITLEGAALVHQSTCGAPDPALVPDCDCTPEQPALAARAAEADVMPDHWAT